MRCPSYKLSEFVISNGKAKHPITKCTGIVQKNWQRSLETRNYLRMKFIR